MDTYFVVIDFSGRYKRFVFDIDFQIYRDNEFNTKDRAMQLIYNYLHNLKKPWAIVINNNDNFRYFDFQNYGINRDSLNKELISLIENFNRKQKATDELYFAYGYRFMAKKVHGTIIYTTFYQSYCNECDDFRDELHAIDLFMLLNDTKKLKDDLEAFFENLEGLLNKLF